ncbi:hypothetical protein HPC49_53375, partial [Pyxidicoccus fallax]|nr:hypothetical protein [Pyxidicoccus fallax]
PQSTSLPELREAMGSPGVIQAEVDALLAAIACPPAGDEPPRARADFLLSLMELPEEARDRKGSNGRTVRAAAVEALLELGYPYALEVHPDVLEAVRLEAGGPKEASGPRISVPGIVVSLLAMVLQVLIVFVAFSVRGRSSWGELFQQLLLALVVVPPLAAIFGQVAELRRTQFLGSVGMGLQALVWLFVSLNNEWGWLLVLLLPWHLCMAAAYLMYPSSEEPGDAPPADTR